MGGLTTPSPWVALFLKGPSKIPFPGDKGGKQKMGELLNSKPRLSFKATVKMATGLHVQAWRPAGKKPTVCISLPARQAFKPHGPSSRPLFCFFLHVTLPCTLACPMSHPVSKPSSRALHSLFYHHHHPETTSRSGPGTPKPSFTCLLQALSFPASDDKDVLSCLSPQNKSGAL